MGQGRYHNSGNRVAIAFIALLIVTTYTPAQAPYHQPAAPEYIKILEDPHRIDHLKPAEIVEKIGFVPGNVAADIGSGSGLFTRLIARAVAPGGKVYAVDIDKDLLGHIAETAAREGITNITPVLAPEDSPSLPPRCLDVALICDTLHHIAKRQTYLVNLKSCLKADGRLVIIDFSDGWPSGHEPLRFSLAELDGWTGAAGYEKVAEYNTIEGNFFRVYRIR
jgi:ubiquinone/menaquinone biosynthesis C-methylase UbiE